MASNTNSPSVWNHGTGERNANIDFGWGGYNGISGLGVGYKAFAKLNSQTITHTPEL